MSHLGPSLRRARRRPSAGRRLAVAVLVSVALNLLLATSLDLSWIASPTTRRDVALSPLSADQWEANRSVLDKVLGREQPRPKQVVDIGGPAEEAEKRASEPPKPSRDDEERFLAQRDSRVEKETRSRHAGLYDTYAPAPSVPAPGGPKGRPDANPAAGQGRTKRAGREELALAGSEALRLQSPRSALDGEVERGDGTPRAPGAQAPLGLPDAQGPAPKLDLRPGARVMAQLSAGPSADDLPDVEEGEATFLNTREWQYAGYYNRIGEGLQLQWQSEGFPAVHARDPDGQRFMYKDRPAFFGMRLDERGNVKSIEVLKSSGLDFLDRIAMDMFRKSSGLVNPPRGMVNARGEVELVYGVRFTGWNPSFGVWQRRSPGE